MNQIFFLFPPSSSVHTSESRTWELYIYIFFFFHSHIQNSLAALSEVQINPSEVEECVLQILASNEV